MKPVRALNVEEVMQRIREAMSANINRNRERFYPQPTQETEEKVEIEEIPVEEVKQPKSVARTRPPKNIGRFSNFAAGKESKMVEDGGRI